MPTHSQFCSSIPSPGKRQKSLLWPHETLLCSVPGQDVFGCVASHQHRGRNPDWEPVEGTVIFPARRRRVWPWVGPVPLAEEGLACGVPLDLVLGRYEESSSVSYNLNEAHKTVFIVEDLCLQKGISLKRLKL